jgi:hypothetical protein
MSVFFGLIFGFVFGALPRTTPLTPALSPKGGEGEREPICVLFEFEFDSVFQVGVLGTFTSVSPLSLWERARVRGFSKVTKF